MKPENQPVISSPEQSLVESMPSVEVSPQDIIDNGVERSAERYEQTAELSSVVSDLAASSSQIVSKQVAITDASSLGVPDDSASSPSVASDDDLIEKEWVDKAKKIVASTHDDPYKREEEVSRLQSDYIKKRYGRELGPS